MTDLVTILDREFLETLELRLVRLCKDKVSVVFEDLQSKPITATPGVRIFPERKGNNICKCMIDCPQNEHAQRLCLVSDSQGATMARTHKKGYLYRCHQGRGFPNFLFPITIWPDEVVGYLYVGQFVFKRLSDDERESFIRRLALSNYMFDDVKRFVSEWYDIDRENFWEYIIGPNLKRDPNFSKMSFSALIENQIDNYGVSPDEFFDIIELIQGLASNLSKLGNSVYLLMTLIEIERRLPPLLKAKYDSALFELREAIASAVTEKGETEVDVHKTVETITDKSLAILMACKNYEDEYIEELVKSYRLGVATPTDHTKNCILQYYARSATFEVILYSKLRTKTRSRTLVEKGDELVVSFFNALASCGQQFQTFQQLVKELFLKMYRESYVQFLLKKKFIPCMRILFDNPADLRKWLVVNGVTDLDIAKYPEGIASFSRTFDLIVWDLESLQNQIRQINISLSKGLTKASRIESLDIGDLNEYLRTMNDLRVRLSKDLSHDRFGTRKCLNQKAYKIFLNSGGLTTTHTAALNEQQKWLAYRNEEGPIGLQLEKELEKKIERTRDLIARYIGAENRHCMVFTHNTTSAIDLVLRGLLKPGDEVLTTDLEHNVVYYLAEYYKKHYGCNIVIAEISEDLLRGKDWLSILTNEIGPRTRLIVISHVLFSTGSVLPIKDIISKCRKASADRRIFILVDGAHAVGNIKVNVKNLDCDFYAFDGHKWLLGPEGIGLLYCKEEYLKADNLFGIYIPLSTAFMVSPRYVPKKMNGRNYELGTMDVAKFIALAPTIESLSKLRFPETSRWRKTLVKKFHEGIKNSRWKILNLKEAAKTGMLCLQIVGRDDRETYKRIVALLEKSNISVRWLNKPKCIRVCLHHYNNETDVEIAVSHLKALLEGVNVHIGNHEKIRSKLKENIKAFLKPSKSRNVTTLVGLNLFSIAGAGKTHVIDKLLKELQKTRSISSSFAIRAKDILKSENPERKFALVLDQALKKTPAVIFIDEADSLFGEKQESIRAIFNNEYNKIIKRKVVFITTVNNPYTIHESVASRLKLAYFPLPDFRTRLEYLIKAARETHCSSKLLLTQLGRLTEWYSMRNLKTLWQTAKGLAADNVLKPEHFETARQSIKRTASDKILKKYTKWIQDLKPKLLTGEIEVD